MTSPPDNVWPPATVCSCRILACRDTLAAALATRFAGLSPEPMDCPTDLPKGVSGRVLKALPCFVAPIRATSIEILHKQAVTRAWSDGAWDVGVSLHAALSGPALGLVDANLDYSSDPGLRDILLEAAARGRLVTWLWRPMREGPRGRQAAHAAKDSSLRADGSRAGEPPPSRQRPDWSWRGERSWVIRLGTWAPEYTPKARPRPATPRQRACITAIHLDAGERPDIPRHLSFAAASAMIDRLKGPTP